MRIGADRFSVLELPGRRDGMLLSLSGAMEIDDASWLRHAFPCGCSKIEISQPKMLKMLKMLKMNKLKLFTDDAYSTWSVLWIVMKRHKSSMRGELPRTVVKLEPKVMQELEERKYRAKKHPGRFAPKIITLPERFVDAAKIVLRDRTIHQSKEQMQDLSQYLFSRKAPVEKDELKDQRRRIEEVIVVKEPKFSQTPASEEDLRLLREKFERKVTFKLGCLTYNWKPLNYDTTKGLVYLLARAAPEYAVLTSIFTEMRLRNEEFEPKAVLDFGSGVGTVFWASYEQWGRGMKEYFAVDTSSHMNDIAQLLVQDGAKGNVPILKGTFFRQFLPASHLLTYDLVVSAYSLMELPSRELRLLTLENLWSKTSEFLVIVEQGTNAGYKLVLEARDFILQASAAEAHVFAPCSHDLACPKLPVGVPCNFEAGYYRLLEKQEDRLVERYSYVVLRKKRRPVGEPWPRIACPVLLRGKHVVCRMCCGDGNLKEIVVTAAKHGKPTYKCTRASRWGDLLPAFDVSGKEDSPQDDREIMENYKDLELPE